jgi:hypothetical protein
MHLGSETGSVRGLALRQDVNGMEDPGLQHPSSMRDLALGYPGGMRYRNDVMSDVALQCPDSVQDLALGHPSDTRDFALQRGINETRGPGL